MTKLQNKKLLFLFSPGMSVERWDHLGVLSRELDIYKRLAAAFDQVWWYSYGQNDFRYADMLRQQNVNLFQTDRRHLIASSYEAYDNKVLKSHQEFFQQFDLVKTNQFQSAYLGLKIKTISRAKLGLRQGLYHPLRWKLTTKRPWAGLREYCDEKRIYTAADIVILPTQTAKDYIVWRHKIRPNKIHVIPNSINTQVFNDPRRSCWGNRLLFIGRLTFAKNVKALLKAVKALDCSLSIIGEGRYRSFIEGYAKKHNLNVRFLETCPNFDLPKIYHQHDILVLPSRYEGSPKVLLEAMACKMTVIGANSWGIREILRNNYNGILCGKRSWQIRRAIKECLNDEGRLKHLGENARKTIERNYSLEKLVEKEINIYHQLLSS